MYTKCLKIEKFKCSHTWSQCFICLLVLTPNISFGTEQKPNIDKKPNIDLQNKKYGIGERAWKLLFLIRQKPVMLGKYWSFVSLGVLIYKMLKLPSTKVVKIKNLLHLILHKWTLVPSWVNECMHEWMKLFLLEDSG